MEGDFWLRNGERNFEENDNWKDKATSYRKKRGNRERNKKESRVKKERDREEFWRKLEIGKNKKKWIYWDIGRS